MTRYSATTLDLSNLSAPTVIADIDFEQILRSRKTDLVERFLSAGISYDVQSLAADPAVVLEEVDGYREVLVRGAINDAAKATMLAFALGSDLDHLAALYGVARRLVTAATDTAAAVYESDTELRRRVQLSPEALTTCGSEAAYVFHALEAASALIDAVPIVGTTASGQTQVRVVCLDRGETGIPSATTLEAARARLMRSDVKPMTVPVSVSGPSVIHYDVAGVLRIAAGPDPSLVASAATSAATALAAARRGLGVDVLRQAYEASARVSGVEVVVLTSPPADIVVSLDAVAICDGISFTTEVIDG